MRQAEVSGHPACYRSFQDEDSDSRARGLWPLCHWGCGIYSFVDCINEPGRLWAYDPNPAPPDEIDVALFPQELTLQMWFARWADGVLFQPTLVQDPETLVWRGATEAEQAEWFTE